MSNVDPDLEGADLPAVLGIHHAADVPEAREAPIRDGTEVGPNVTLATCPDFEHGAMAAVVPASVTLRNGGVSGAFGSAGVSGAGVTRRTGGAQWGPVTLTHLPAGSTGIGLPAPPPSRSMVVGGAPRGERLAIRPGFAARPTEEIASARESRMGDDGRFGRAHGHDGDPPPAPPLPPGTANHAD